MQEVVAAAIAVRVNMERLPALRLAKEANAVKTEIATSNRPKRQTEKVLVPRDTSLQCSSQ
jgi:hypothetical protein